MTGKWPGEYWEMEKLSLSEILKATGGKLISGDQGAEIRSISTDTRTLKEGDFFIALKGKNFDGHDFLKDALERKARGALLGKDSGFRTQNSGFIVIKVEDTLDALQDLAGYYRNKFSIPVIAITGSNGKTTVKEMLAHILSKNYSVLKAPASYNNEVGLPLTLLGLSHLKQVAVLEIGTSAPGEVSRLVQISRPSLGVITNIGEAHLEYLGSREKIAREKGELFTRLGPEDKAVLNEDDPLIREMKGKIKARILTYGVEKKADFQAQGVKDRGETLEFSLKGVNINLPLPGYYNVYNALAASATAGALGVDLNLIKEGLESFPGVPLRMEVTSLGGLKIINDAYNANPTSMRASLLSLKNISESSAPGNRGRKIAVLGDMLELGEESFSFHQEIGKFAAKTVDFLLTVGNLSKIIVRSALEEGLEEEKVFICQDNKEAAEHLLRITRPGDTILIKGSRKMKMEEVVNALSSIISSP
jgi:UDP-N-acetylmuramoyl-tripeptide--D-alanyl-D-alanine ligase